MKKKLPPEIRMNQEAIREILTTQRGSHPFCSKNRNIIHKPTEKPKDSYQFAITSYVLRPLEDQIASTNVAYCVVGVVGSCEEGVPISPEIKEKFEEFEDIPVIIGDPEFRDAEIRGYTVIMDRIRERTQDREESLLLSKFLLLSDFINERDNEREIFIFKNNEIILNSKDQHKIEILDEGSVNNTWLIGLHTAPDFLSLKYLWDSVPNIEQYIEGDKDSIIRGDSRILSHCLWVGERSSLFKEEKNYKVSFYFKLGEDARPNLIDIYVPKKFRETFDKFSYSIDETMDKVADKITHILKEGHLTRIGSSVGEIIGRDKIIPMLMMNAYENLYGKMADKRMKMDEQYEEWGWKRRR